MKRFRDEGEEYITAIPRLRKWINECAMCHRKGYRPDIPDRISVVEGCQDVYYIKKYFKPLEINSDVSAIIVESAVLLIAFGFLSYMLYNLRIWKDIKKWLLDAVELTVVPEYLDGNPVSLGLVGFSPLLLPADIAVAKNLKNTSIQVRFKLNDRWCCLWSKRMPAWNYYVGRETKILYSEKYNQVIVMKLPILSEE